eukprot:gnl/MRDRNA2_/MRDRNA2_75292_c0_seq1.p1 gnl/MRDRNA2_/MRDRNA2_75292_c0~~gnl/MRDRNA2_/MRDRNA2_75292_c0_seq1.p1  ORF type:complete len:285 (-),score=62.85 gnl/MRDRNA2_/MRDRNA2_75292_c0_seq1:120-974(-)
MFWKGKSPQDSQDEAVNPPVQDGIDGHRQDGGRAGHNSQGQDADDAGIDLDTGLPVHVVRGVMAAASAMGDYRALQHRERKLQAQVRELQRQAEILQSNSSNCIEADSKIQAQSSDIETFLHPACTEDDEYCPITVIESQCRNSINGEGIANFHSFKSEMDYRATECHDALEDVRRPWLQVEKMEGRMKKFPNSNTMANDSHFIDSKEKQEQEKLRQQELERQQQEVDESFLGQFAQTLGWHLEVVPDDEQDPSTDGPNDVAEKPVMFGLMSTLVPEQSQASET